MFNKTVWTLLALSLLLNLSACAEGNMTMKKNQAPDLSSKQVHPPAPAHNE